jgi:hypothetical protein
MRCHSSSRWTPARLLPCLLAVLAALAPRPAAAVEALDGRVQVHGYFEAQIRSIVRDFDFSDDWDLTQWWNVLSLEIEANVAPEGIGPFDVISIFSRIEVRYDCVWTGACSMFDSADAYAFSSHGKLPKRLIDARRTGYQGTSYIDDTRHYYDIPFEEISSAPDERRLRPDGSRSPLEFWQTPLGRGFFGSLSYGPDGEPRTPDDLGFFYFEDLVSGHCQRWGAIARPGPQDGRGPGSTLLLDPNCEYDPIGANRDKPNPFNSSDFSPIINTTGSAALPYRPAPEFNADSGAPLQYARGVYYPNYRLQQLLADDDITPISTKFRRGELAWNRGQSQQEQKELKELYADIEMFDSRLWLRIGYQTIVWGKTELFRNQDQFNPQDIGLASLPSLEESRISLWALRAIWSFYDVGPLNDVRLEFAMNYDQWQSIDPGVCGEPYAPLPVCQLNEATIAHGYLGLGLAGIELPPDPWNSLQGIELGARLEFRWDRFSFAITDFYGFQDFPYLKEIFQYSRNVDPVSGRPRHTMSSGRCRTGKEPACLDSGNALTQHSANQQLFAAACASSLAVAPDLDPTACLANIFGSPALTPPNDVLPVSPRVVVVLNTIGRGDTSGPAVGDGAFLAGLIGADAASLGDEIAKVSYNGQVRKITIDLNVDPFDGDNPDYANASKNNPLIGAADFDESVAFFYEGALINGSLSGRLTDWQEALLGCGPFFQTSCDLDGVDVLNMEGGVFFQSFTNVAGTFQGPDESWDTFDKSRPQPGTVGFQGSPLCSRYENGKTYILPGCRGPGDDGYNVKQDGSTTGLIHPFTGQQFANELAVLSWNLMMGVAGFAMPGDDGIQPQDFDVDNPFRLGGCSFRQPQLCGTVAALLDLSGQQRNSIRAGGNGRFGRTDFVHHSGGVGILKVDKSNVFGFSMDFAEDLTKSNWGIEFTWVEGLHVGDNEEFDGLADGVDLYRLSISADRPTFVNFMNANRTFFINTQWFFQYTDEFRSSYSSGYQWDIFGVLAIATGYFQDRLLPSLTLVYFVNGNSFAVLPQVTYRFTENFQATFGVAAFAGRYQERVAPIDGIAPVGQRFGRNAYKTFVEPGLAAVRERDEIYLRIRYTF